MMSPASAPAQSFDALKAQEINDSLHPIYKIRVGGTFMVEPSAWGEEAINVMAVVMKQQNRPLLAVSASSLDNVLIDVFRKCG